MSLTSEELSEFRKLHAASKGSRVRFGSGEDDRDLVHEVIGPENKQTQKKSVISTCVPPESKLPKFSEIEKKSEIPFENKEIQSETSSKFREFLKLKVESEVKKARGRPLKKEKDKIQQITIKIRPEYKRYLDEIGECPGRYGSNICFKP